MITFWLKVLVQGGVRFLVPLVPDLSGFHSTGYLCGLTGTLEFRFRVNL